MSSLAEAQLENPVWHALGGPHAAFADTRSTARARRYHPEVSVFSAAESVDERSWTALGDLVGPSGMVALFRDRVPAPPAGWTEVFRARARQMISPTVDAAPAPPEVSTLGPGDVGDMLALIDAAQPGPFEVRTPELGRYVGVRRDGRLVAMAGERFRVPGATEISAVCTHETVRGEGWGRILTTEVARGIQARGDVAFLHVVTDNEPAATLYRAMGFTTRRVLDVVGAVRDV